MTFPLFTIGYARAAQDSLIHTLVETGVEVLADVRALPNSRRPGFSKNSLAAAVQEAGIEYRHFKCLGTPRDGREAARRGDRATLRRVYEGQLQLPEALAQMAELQSIARGQPTCLLCYCEETADCHRALLIEHAFADRETIDLHASTGPT